jgi:hypothetical protein
MRHLVWLGALGGVAFLALQAGTIPTKKVSADLMDIAQIQMQADKSMPKSVIKADLY